MKECEANVMWKGWRYNLAIRRL